MVSDRNIETTAKYQLLKKYVSLTPDQIKHTKATSIQEAIDDVVRMVDGGEYLMNVKIYLVQHDHYGSASTFNYAVEGDVWGTTSK
jgi:hypothetical protein